MEVRAGGRQREEEHCHLSQEVGCSLVVVASALASSSVAQE